MTRKLTREEFIERAKNKHENKYTYDNVVYLDARSPVYVTCPIKGHGDWPVTPDSHMRTSGCPTCAKILRSKKRTLSTEIFIKRAKDTHGDTFSYEKSEYISCYIPITVTCKIHGDFEVISNVHWKGFGCSKCSGNFHKNTDYFIEECKEVWKNRYTYENLQYFNCKTKILVTCPEHGDFPTYPPIFLHKKSGCPTCGIISSSEKRKSNTEKFIEKARLFHGDKYDYSKVVYVKNRLNVTITCPIHGDFTITPSHHLSGQGCSDCKNKSEGKIFLILKELFPYYTIIRQNPIVGKGRNSLKIDFHVVELNLYIELDGDQHFSQVSNWEAPELTQAHDLTKTIRVLKKGQSLVRIYQPWVASDTNNWLDKLKANIREYENPTVVFIGPEGIYDKHKEDLRYSSLSNNLYETSTFS